MYGLNVIAFIMLIAVHLLASSFCKHGSAVRARITRNVCLPLLTLTAARYAISPLLGKGFTVPVEYSSVAYFAVPIILLTGWKRLQSWAAYSGAMAGFFYYITMVTAGGPIYQAYPPLEIYFSMYCHATLYFCGLVSLRTDQFPSSDWLRLVACTACVAIWALLFRPLVEGTERFFIYELLDGIYVRQLCPSTLLPIALPGYYVLLFCLVLLSIREFFRLNRLRACKSAPSQKSLPAL